MKKTKTKCQHCGESKGYITQFKATGWITFGYDSYGDENDDYNDNSEMYEGVSEGVFINCTCEDCHKPYAKYDHKLKKLIFEEVGLEERLKDFKFESTLDDIKTILATRSIHELGKLKAWMESMGCDGEEEIILGDKKFLETCTGLLQLTSIGLVLVPVGHDIEYYKI